MTFTTYPDLEQTQLTAEILSIASAHQATPLYRWRTALEQVNPEVITIEPYCMGSALVAVYDPLDVAADAWFLCAMYTNRRLRYATRWNRRAAFALAILLLLTLS